MDLMKVRFPLILSDFGLKSRPSGRSPSALLGPDGDRLFSAMLLREALFLHT
jgi:hypothetical protein